MSAVASPSAAPTPSRPTLKRRHDSSSDDDDDVGAKQRYFYVLAPESSDYSSDGTESIYSVQAKSTDVARDTSDTSSKDSWTGSEDSRMFELEVVSLSESDRAFPFPVTTSSSPEDMERVPSVDSELEPTAAGSSRRSADSDDEGEGKGRLRSLGLFSFCRQCKGFNTDPHFMYCIRCHRLRKSFLPERPRGKRVKSKKQLEDFAKEEDAQDSGIYSQTSAGTFSLDNTPPLGPDPTSAQVCQICMVNPRDGGFCHDNIVHVYSCYRCSVKTFKQRGRCPVCNRRPRHVSKVITV